MSIALSTETKEVEITKEERTWRIELFTEAGSDYYAICHREIKESHDGDIKKLDRDSLEVNQLRFLLADTLASSETVSYKDIGGTDKTIPMKDVGMIIPAAIEMLIAAEKASLAE